jgi:hypothetical protein
VRALDYSGTALLALGGALAIVDVELLVHGRPRRAR